MKHLTLEQRYEISAYLKCGKSQSYIAEALGKDKSTISRELKRNLTSKGKYSPGQAQQQYEIRQERLKRERKFTPEVRCFAEEKIKGEQWSPRQISGFCKKHSIPMVSHQRLYQFVREDKENGGTLYQNMRHKLKQRRRPVGENIPIKNRVSIDNAPMLWTKKNVLGTGK